jgi:beta-mannosidase
MVEVHLDVERIAVGELGMKALVTAPDGRRFTAEVVDEGDELVATIGIPNPERWWPRGLGEQPLYELEVELFKGEELLDTAQRRLGLRSVELDEENFAIHVNGKRIFCRGANWIPDGLFPGTAPSQRVEKRIQQAAECGMNMLRVWGGGLYEQPAFYETCDRLGIMVWQDFMFACATYPEEDPYPALIDTEVRYQVGRLSHHASIVLWCGGNENVLAWRNWGWKQRMPETQTWGKRYFTELLPAICAQLDPSRPYWPDSPWSGSIDVDPNDPDCGDRHTWDFKMEDVRQIVPRFVSEFGHQAPPLARTIQEALGDGGIEAMAFRQRAWGGDQAEYVQHLEKWFEPARSPQQLLAQMHLMQARATSLTIDWLRANGTRCGGALIWQLNDAWTGHSWSLIDVAGRPKPSWWAAKASFADRLLTVQPRGDSLRAVAVNDHPEIWHAEARVRRVEFSGEVRAEEQFQLHVETGGLGSVTIPSSLAEPEHPQSEFLLIEAGENRACWFFDVDRRLAYPEPDFDLHLESREGGDQMLRIEARSLLRDVIFDVSKLCSTAEIEANLFTMLPGESRTLRCRGLEGLSSEALLQPGVIFIAAQIT